MTTLWGPEVVAVKIPQIWAHRGAPQGRGELPPENSLAAFRRALSNGCDALEFDLHITKDDHFVIFHDLEMDHPTLGRVPLCDCTLDVIREKKLSDGSDIPVFQDIVDLAQNSETPLIPELKRPEEGERRGLRPVETLCELLDRFKSSHEVVVQCFNSQALHSLRERRPKTPLLALYRHDQKVHLEKVPGDAEYLGVPMLSVFFYGEKLVRKAEAMGKKVVPWREMALSENEEVFRRLAEFGVHAVMVDDARRALIHYGRIPEPENFKEYEWELMKQEEPVDCRRSRHP